MPYVITYTKTGQGQKQILDVLHDLNQREKNIGTTTSTLTVPDYDTARELIEALKQDHAFVSAAFVNS
jgi:hypothetical protein